jgi:hypothetical protein
MVFDLLSISDRIKAQNYLKELVTKKVEIKEYRPKRTNDANRYYWAILTFLECETGQDKNQLHLFFREMFLEHRQITVLNKEIIEIQSTTELNTKQFYEYCEKIRIFVIENLGFDIPEMSTDEFIQFVEHYRQYE